MLSVVQDDTNIINIIAPSGGVVKDVPIMIATTSICVIPVNTAAAGDLVAVRTRGVFNLPKSTSAAFTLGQKVEWDVSAGELIALGAVAGDIEVGYVVKAAATSDTHAHVLVGYAPPAVNA